MSYLYRLAFVAIAFASGSLTSLSSAHAGTSEIRVVSSGKCLDVPYSSPEAGVQLIQWDCNGGLNQAFERLHYADGTVAFRNAATGMCIDTQTTYGVERVIQWPCHNGKDQRFRIHAGSRGFTLRSAYHGFCLDITNASYENGAGLETYRCNGQDNQRFYYNFNY